jgi:O-antigen ligase
MVTFLLTSALAATALAVGLLVLWYCALRRPVEFIALVVGVWIASVALRESMSLSLVIASFQVSTIDVLAMVMAAVALSRFALHGARSGAGGLTLALAALLAVHLGRGVADFGLEAAINSGRTTLYFVAALAYAATVPGGWDSRVWKVLISAGALLAVLAVPFWLTGGLGSAETFVVRDGEVLTSRPVVAAGALVILQAAILSLALRWPSRRLAAHIALATGVAVILLQHRTVWLAGLAVAVVGFFLWSARLGRRADRAVFAAVGVTLLLLPVGAWGLSSTEPLVSSAKEVASEGSTLEWRTAGWRQLVASNDSVPEVVGGGPSGASFERRVDGRVVDVSAHNALLEVFLRMGILGAAALALLGLVLWLGRAQVADATGLPQAGVTLLLLTQFLFSAAYSLDAVQGIVTGVFVSGLAAARAPGAVRRPRAVGAT